MGQYIITYDLGTGGNKASLYDQEGEYQSQLGDMLAKLEL